MIVLITYVSSAAITHCLFKVYVRDVLNNMWFE